MRLDVEGQRAANRRNAEQSTGPKTARGKEAVARNALRHGLRAEKVLTFDEKSADFEAFLGAQREAFQPADAVEEQLVERIALCAWRLRRIYRVEADVMDCWRKADMGVREDIDIGAAFDSDPDQMWKLSRYEAALDHAFNRAYVMLERRQARRRGENVPVPLTVAVAGFRGALRPEGAIAQSENFRTKPISPTESEAAPESEAAES
ncbi:MAG TPA: hypothetical protein VKV32_13275 [Stellaceae bacterium]|nr:hypothetical protein [Stellaceae bacterium]